jgi:hypothetical protein
MANWHWPQYLVAFYFAVKLFGHGINNGKPYRANVSFAMAFFDVGVFSLVLHCGGFF